MQPINKFQEEAENETINFSFRGNYPIRWSMENLTLTASQIIEWKALRAFEEDVYELPEGWIKKDVPKLVYFGEFFLFGKEKYIDGAMRKENATEFIPGFYSSMAIATAKKLIEINLARLVSEDNEKNAKAELLNVKNLLLEEQVNSQIAQSSIESLEIAKVNILNDLNLVITDKNQIQDELDQGNLKLEEAKSLIQEQKALIENQNAENNLLRRTMEEMAASINSLKDEKLKYSIENISLESKFKTEKIEYKRRIKESGETITYFRSELNEKKQELIQKTFELSQISHEYKNQHFDSQQESFATSDDEEEILAHNFKIM